MPPAVPAARLGHVLSVSLAVGLLLPIVYVAPTRGVAVVSLSWLASALRVLRGKASTVRRRWGHLPTLSVSVPLLWV